MKYFFIVESKSNQFFQSHDILDTISMNGAFTEHGTFTEHGIIFTKHGAFTKHGVSIKHGAFIPDEKLTEQHEV